MILQVLAFWVGTNRNAKSSLADCSFDPIFTGLRKQNGRNYVKVVYIYIISIYIRALPDRVTEAGKKTPPWQTGASSHEGNLSMLGVWLPYDWRWHLALFQWLDARRDPVFTMLNWHTPPCPDMLKVDKSPTTSSFFAFVSAWGQKFRKIVPFNLCVRRLQA